MCLFLYKKQPVEKETVALLVKHAYKLTGNIILGSHFPVKPLLTTPFVVFWE